MKAVFEQVKSDPSKVLLVRHFRIPQFDAPFHFHPEYELTLIVKGEGQRFVGKQVDDFSDGDLVFLGSHLPHCWINHQKDCHSLNLRIVLFIQKLLKIFLFMTDC